LSVTLSYTKEKVEKHKRGKWKKEREEDPMESIA